MKNKKTRGPVNKPFVKAEISTFENVLSVWVHTLSFFLSTQLIPDCKNVIRYYLSTMKSRNSEKNNYIDLFTLGLTIHFFKLLIFSSATFHFQLTSVFWVRYFAFLS